MSQISQPHVLIIGGGIGGLALANGLKKHGISFHVFERDRTESYRAQGYRIRLRGTAVDALRHLLDDPTFDDFNLSCADLSVEKIPEIDAETAKADFPDLEDVPKGVDEEVKRTRCVDRAAFRDALMKHLAPGEISYDKAFERFEESTDGVLAYFTDGSTAQGTLLVGADGKNSRVRKQLLPWIVPADMDIRCIYGKTMISPELKKSLEPIAGSSMSFVKDRTREEVLAMGLEPITFSKHDEREARGLLTPHDYLFWGISASPSALGLDGEAAYLNAADSQKKALEMSEKWHPVLRAIIEQQAEGETAAFGLMAVKPGMEGWEANEHATCIGDAVHPMAPTGSGAVTALQDASTLCKILTAKGQSQASIKEYEDHMRSNVAPHLETSWRALRGIVGMTRQNEIHLGEMAMRIRIKNMQQQVSQG